MAELWEQDPPDDDFALPGDEALTNQAVAEPEPEAPAEEPAVEEEVEEAAPEKPRNEKGQFVSETQEEASEEPPELILGKFKTQEDLVKSYTELERAFHDAAREPEPVAPTQGYDLGAIQDALDENPTKIPQVAVAAYNDGDEDVLDAAIVAWENHDPLGAKRFQREIMLDRVRKEQEAATGEKAKQSASWVESGREFAKDHPDYGRLREAMMSLTSEYPDVVGLLKQDNPNVRRQVLSFLYGEAQRRESDNAALQARKANEANDASAEQAIEEASVVSGNSAHNETQKTGAELLGEQWDALDSAVDDGWNV